MSLRIKSKVLSSENYLDEKKIIFYIKYIWYSMFFLIKNNGPYIIIKNTELIIKIILKLTLFLVLGNLFSIDLFVIPVYCPPIVIKNMAYLRRKEILNKRQLAAIYGLLSKNFRSITQLKLQLTQTLRRLNLKSKDISLILELLMEVYEQYGSLKNRINSRIWNAHFAEALLRGVVSEIDIPPSLVYLLGYQTEYKKDKKDPSKREFYLKHLTGFFILCYFTIQSFYGVLNNNKDFFWKHQITFGATFFIIWYLLYYFFILAWYSLIPTLSVIPFTIGLVLLLDTIYYGKGLKSKLFLDWGWWNIYRSRKNNIMLLNSTTIDFKYKFYELLKNAFRGNSRYLNMVSFKTQLDGGVLFPETLYTIKIFSTSKQGLGLDNIMLLIFNYLLFINSFMAMLSKTTENTQYIVSQLESSPLDPENLVIMGHRPMLVWTLVTITLCLFNTLFYVVPNSILNYLISPLIHNNTLYAPFFCNSATMAYLYWTRIKETNTTDKEKQKASGFISGIIGTFFLIIRPIIINLSCIFNPVKIILKDNYGRIIKKFDYKPDTWAALLLDYSIYTISDLTFSKSYPLMLEDHKVYTYL